MGISCIEGGDDMAKLYDITCKARRAMVTPLQIAEFFIAHANIYGDLITNLKLQKLVYYAQAWNLAIFGRPLFQEEFEAWVHGPVLPSLYQEFKEFRWKPIERDLDETSYNKIRLQLGQEISELLDEIIEEYCSLSGHELEQLTHAEEPWVRARNGCACDAICHNIIDKGLMEQYYAARLVD